jgi:lipopolysaccharide/colanic/teichoic acid biosynthesis glycosyltransferase
MWACGLCRTPADIILLVAPSRSPKGLRIKRAFDLAVLAGAHLALLPVWLLFWTLIPIAIVLDSGFPVFYGQERVGRDGKRFHAIKFRTMVRAADRIGPAQTDRDDPRLTRVGRLLRRTALDELPQVINILRGEMSFVGPRALSVADIDSMRASFPDLDARFAVPAGLTGLAQVYAGRDDNEAKLRYDLKYIETRSLWLDLRLILQSALKTVGASWDESGAEGPES